MATIKEVAAEAGVSIATVSNCINGTKPLSQKTEKRVKDAIEKLDYSPNISARSLKSNRYNDICILLPNLDEPYYSQIYQGIESVFQNTEFFLNLSFTNDIPEVEEKIVGGMLEKNICGMILVTCRPNSWRSYYEHFSTINKPLVLIDRMIQNLATSFVSINYYKIMNDIITTLIGNGKKNIYLLCGPDAFTADHECIRGYTEAFQQSGLTPDEGKIITSVLHKEDAFKQAIRLLNKEIPEAIVTVSEINATGVVEALTFLGYDKTEIPVITMGEQHWNKFTHTFASHSITRPAIKIGEKASEIFISNIRSPKTFEKEHFILESATASADLQALTASPPQILTKGVNPCEEINILALNTKQIDALRGLLPNFEKQTGIVSNLEILPHNQILQKIIQQHQNKDAMPQSDIYMFDIPWLYSLASSGILTDLTEHINDASFDADIFLPDCLKYYSEFDGHYYALPFMYAPQIFYYRKDLFENRSLILEYEKRYHSKLKPPRTWTEYTAMVEFFTKCRLPANKVEYGTSIPVAFMEYALPELYTRLWAFGGNVYDRHFRVVFNSPQTLKAYVSLISSLQVAKPDFMETTDVSAVVDFTEGKTAMIITYPSFLTDLVDLRQSNLIGSIGYSHIPGRRPILGGWSIGISSNSYKKDAAFKFLKWAASEDTANYLTLLGGQPAISSIYTNDEMNSLYPWLPLYYSVFQQVKPIIPPYKRDRHIIPQDKIDSIIYKHLCDIINNSIEIPDAIEFTHIELAELFREYNY